MIGKLGSSKTDLAIVSPYGSPITAIAEIKFTGVRPNLLRNSFTEPGSRESPYDLASISASWATPTSWRNWSPLSVPTQPDKCGGTHSKKVLNQLMRAGLGDSPLRADRWSRFETTGSNLGVRVRLVPFPVDPDNDDNDEGGQTKPSNWTTTIVTLPDPFWPTALGLDQRRELEFLRALSESDPILCLLHVPTEVQSQAWIQGAWEGLSGWAYRSAQRFCLRDGNSTAEARIRVGPAALLHTYLKPSVLESDAPRLADLAHDLNLITIKNELELPTDFARLNAVWPASGLLNSSPITKANHRQTSNRSIVASWPLPARHQTTRRISRRSVC